ncbi:hypothetical protein ACSFA3_13650 [Variovorax sp. RHLX14]|uniref:hypothetical protein n=1 Tax=Variovorax sp. RHLX14 TaxID=1259731 RepID=UPI003F47983A
MPYVLLARLAGEQLPIDITAAEDIHKLLSLQAAGLVVARIPAYIPDRQGGRYASAATVTAVTQTGIAAIKKRRN